MAALWAAGGENQEIAALTLHRLWWALVVASGSIESSVQIALKS